MVKYGAASRPVVKRETWPASPSSRKPSPPTAVPSKPKGTRKRRRSKAPRLVFPKVSPGPKRRKVPHKQTEPAKQLAK